MSDDINNSLKRACELVCLAEMEAMSLEDIPEHVFSEEFERKMSVLLKSMENKKAGESTAAVKHAPYRRFLKCAAMAAVILVILISVCACVPTIKDVLISLRIIPASDHSDIEFEQTEGVSLDDEFTYVAPDTPEGYFISDEEKCENAYRIEYSDGGDGMLLYQQVNESDNKHSINTEFSEYEEVYVNGCKGVLYNSISNINVVWKDENYYYKISGNAEIDVIMEMSKSAMNKKIRKI